MDILARIEEVIKQRGTNKAEVSDKMGKAKQNFKSLLTNPKWDSLELVCKAIGIEPWQLFEQEIMAAGYRRTAEPKPSEEEKTDNPQIDKGQINKTAAAPTEGAEQAGQAAEDANRNGVRQSAAPEAPNQQAEPVKAVRFQYQCPACGRQIKVTIEQA